MMKNKTSLITLLFFIIPFISFSQEEAIQKGLDAIHKESVKAQLEFLSSDWMEGRATGTKGEFLSADYLASMLQFIGIDGAGDEAWTKVSRENRRKGIRPTKYTSYFQNYYLTEFLEESSEISIITGKNQDKVMFNEKTDFSTSGYMFNIDKTSDIVFVGYGYTNEEHGYDDFKGVDVKDKFILRINGYPGHLDTNSTGYKKFHNKRQYFNYYLEREKNKIAKEKGALGIINVYQDELAGYWSRENDFMNKSENESPQPKLYENPIRMINKDTKARVINIYPSDQLVNEILKGQNLDIEYFEKTVAVSLRPESKKLKNAKINFKQKNKTELLQTRNILGVIEGENKDEIVVIGAHYDHVGMNDGFIWNGADDNASGTVGIWMLAKAFKASGVKPKKTIVFAAWSGEELGLYGSEYFANNPYGDKIENIKLYLNFDMISKSSTTDTLMVKTNLMYTENNLKIKDITEEHIKKYNLNLEIKYTEAQSGHSSSDHASFREKNVPIMYFNAGYPPNLHTPKDEVSDVEYDKMIDIIKLSFLNLWKIVHEK